MALGFDRHGLIPPQVENLAPCEKEVATIIYVYGPMTAKTIEAHHLSRKITNSALRSMLGRLCRKQILKRHKITGSHMTSDRRIPYLYTPAITPEALRIRALVEVARDYFNGSLPRMAKELAGLCCSDDRVQYPDGEMGPAADARRAA